jgi:hypothetical protein
MLNPLRLLTRVAMPKISQFLGIMIFMYFRDHSPPHFHAKYGDFEGIISLNPIRLIEGKLPPRILGLVIEWATLYSVELISAWNAAESGDAIPKVPPLV